MKQMMMWAWCLAVTAGAPAHGRDRRDRRDRREPGGRDRSERGDVPGWVLVTIMTAGLVTMLWRFAGPQLQQMLSNALAQVSG